MTIQSYALLAIATSVTVFAAVIGLQLRRNSLYRKPVRR